MNLRHDQAVTTENDMDMEDTALFDGPKPIMFETVDVDNLALVLSGNERDTSQIEFGAHQVR